MLFRPPVKTTGVTAELVTTASMRAGPGMAGGAATPEETAGASGRPAMWIGAAALAAGDAAGTVLT